VLLTLSGHAKLTDFGAARPLPGSAAALATLAKARHVLLELRDGDWRAKAAAEQAAEAAAAAPMEVDAPMEVGAPAVDAEAEAAAIAEAEAEAAAARLEGTATYLSPELVAGGRPTVASDCWAFGCTLYQARRPSRLRSPRPASARAPSVRRRCAAGRRCGRRARRR